MACDRQSQARARWTHRSGRAGHIDVLAGEQLSKAGTILKAVVQGGRCPPNERLFLPCRDAARRSHFHGGIRLGTPAIRRWTRPQKRALAMTAVDSSAFKYV